MSLSNDLIAAIATPTGMGGVGILRLSGPQAYATAQQLIGTTLQPRTAKHCDFCDPENGELIDQGLALWFAEGASFTGEEVVELHAHGSPVVMQQLLSAVCVAGARIARPGEFSERAYLNGKLDLAQAEAIADLIASGSEAAARAAARSLRGEFSRLVNEQAERLEMLRVFVEAVIDFPDEEVEHLEQGQVADAIAQLIAAIQTLLNQAEQGHLINKGATVALIGPPNAGKSSLLNALSGEDSAIVTEVPGTTRDVLKVDLVLDGVPLRLADTAGLRQTEDVVEQIGVARAREQLEIADVVLLVLDVSGLRPDQVLGDQWLADQVSALGLSDQWQDLRAQTVLVLNKVDLIEGSSERRISTSQEINVAAVETAVKFGWGIGDVTQTLLHKLGKQAEPAGFTARARHIVELQESLADLQLALSNLEQGVSAELIAEELRNAHLHMGEIVGTTTPDELLGRIFSEFCIGK